MSPVCSDELNTRLLPTDRIIPAAHRTGAEEGQRLSGRRDVAPQRLGQSAGTGDETLLGEAIDGKPHTSAKRGANCSCLNFATHPPHTVHHHHHHLKSSHIHYPVPRTGSVTLSLKRPFFTRCCFGSNIFAFLLEKYVFRDEDSKKDTQ